MKEKDDMAKLNADRFALILQEFLAGPCTAANLSEVSGMSYRYMHRLLRAMAARGVIHVSAWERDAIGRVGVKVWSLGAGKTARKPRKTREQINRDYRESRAREPLKGTPFYGLTMYASNDGERRAA